MKKKLIKPPVIGISVSTEPSQTTLVKMLVPELKKVTVEDLVLNLPPA
jgi:hypothetical protein